jgi:Flp pilus assembly protein TadG
MKSEVRSMRRRLNDESGVVMIEAVLGIVMLLLAALAAIQVMLYTHAAVVARSAATAAARSYALSGSKTTAEHDYEVQQGNAFKMVKWNGLVLERAGDRASATVKVTVPALFPGAAVLGGGKLTDPFHLEEIGEYPLGGDN